MTLNDRYIKITLFIVLAFSVPLFACAGDAPDWEITYEYEQNGTFYLISDGGSYDIPVGESVTTRHSFPSDHQYGWASVFKGVPGNAQLMNHYTIGRGADADLLETAPFRFGEGSYFLVIYDIREVPNMYNFAQIIQQFSNGSTGVYPTSWGMVRFTIGKKPICCSNVLFLPGFQASRLYEMTDRGEEVLWPPSTVQNSIYRLYLDKKGNSINEIYTKQEGVISEIIAPFTTFHFYTKFLQQLQSLALNGTIHTYRTFPYDWRMDAIDIVDKGTPYNDGKKSPLNVVEELASSSNTGKVTIIGHSYGGVIAKAIAYRLYQAGKERLIDSVIMVGSPQLGTPKTIASMLHGDFQSIPSWAGFVMSKANARGVSENMKGAYNLLPSPSYFQAISDPVINTMRAPGVEELGGAGESLIAREAEFSRFITGAGGRIDPPYLATDKVNVLSSELLSDVRVGSHAIDAWSPASTTIKFIQIAGTGLDTPKNIVYEEEGRTFCSKLSLQCSHATSTTHTVEMTLDGDGTVVLPSATTMSLAAKYFVSLRDVKGVYDKKYEHPTLFEIPPVVDLLRDLVSTTTYSVDGVLVRTSAPQFDLVDTLRLRMYSPVDVHVFDEKARHTGKRLVDSDPEFYYKEEDIPGSYYEEVGEVKYIGLPGNKRYRIYLIGTGEGKFTFEMESVRGDSQSTIIRFSDLPVSASTTAYIDVFSNGTFGSLEVDVEGDGIVDDRSLPGRQLSSAALLHLIQAKITQSALTQNDQKHLQHDLDRIREAVSLQVKQGDTKDILKRCVQFENQIRLIYKKDGISSGDAERLLELLGLLTKQL